MKKKIVSLVLAVIMMFGTTFTAFAADTKVQALYDKYVALETAYEGTSIDALRTASLALEEPFNDAMEDFSDAQWQEFGTLCGKDYEEALMEMLVTYIYANVIITIDDAENEYLATPNALNALNLCEAYESIMLDDTGIDDSMIEDVEDVEEIRADINRLIPTLTSSYNAAKNDLPSSAVMKIYDTYYELSNALWGEIEDVKAVVGDELTNTINSIDTLSAQDKADLEAILDETAADIKAEMIDMENEAKAILLIADEYLAFDEDPNRETAKAFIDKYNEIFKGSQTPKATKEAIEDFYYDLDERLDEAKAILEGKNPYEGSEKGEWGDKFDNKISPLTGDNSAMPYIFGIMIMSLVSLAAVSFANKKSEE